MAQTDLSSYGYELDKAQAGQKSDVGFGHVESFAAEGAVFFGAGVVHGTAPEKQVAVPADDSGIFAGVALFDHSQVQGIDMAAAAGGQYSTGAEYRDTDTVSVMRRGRVWVEVTAEVAAGETAYVDVITAEEDGKWTNVADDGAGTDNLATGGVFRSAADAGDLAIVEINLP